jgi:hypothetical protein
MRDEGRRPLAAYLKEAFASLKSEI